jgi:hypothetical protein
MKIKLLLFCLISFSMHAQSLIPSVSRDSLFKSLITRFNATQQEEFNREYSATPPGKEQDLLLYVMSLPQGSKKIMEDNLAANQTFFNQLVHRFTAMIPQEHSVSVTFHAENALFNLPERIDISIYGPIPGTDLESPALAPGSKQLAAVLQRLGWAQQDLDKLKEALKKAGCTGIQNGFAGFDITFTSNHKERYSYIVFNKDVSPTAVKEYVSDCTSIQYNNSIVLQYTGSTGTECFPQ